MSEAPQRSSFVQAALVAVLCLGSAGAAAAQERLVETRALFSSSDDVERGRSSVVFDTLWTFGGPSDTVLASPWVLRPDGTGGVVGQMGRQRMGVRFLVGNGWMAFRGGELLGTYPYVEHVDFPKMREVRNGNSVRRRPVRRPAETGRSLSVVGDTLFVLFGGENESRFRGWVLDKFDMRSGTYLGTDVLPHYANRAVVDGDRAFTIHFGGGSGSALFPRIVALARRSAPQQ